MPTKQIRSAAHDRYETNSQRPRATACRIEYPPCRGVTDDLFKGDRSAFPPRVPLLRDRLGYRDLPGRRVELPLEHRRESNPADHRCLLDLLEHRGRRGEGRAVLPDPREAQPANRAGLSVDD